MRWESTPNRARRSTTPGASSSFAGLGGFSADTQTACHWKMMATAAFVRCGPSDGGRSVFPPGLRDFVRCGTLRRQRQGVELLLYGDGADELLGAPRFASAAIACRQGVRASSQYGADVARTGPGLAGEAAAVLASALPRRIRAELGWAACWPEMSRPEASHVLTEPMRAVAAEWAREYIRAELDACARAARSWAATEAHGKLWPHDLILASGVVPEASPFLTEPFFSKALGVPLADRYDPALPAAYLRAKAQVVGQLPERLWTHLPGRKQYFTRAIHAACPGVIAAPRAVAAGLFGPVSLAACRDVTTRLVAAAVEEWLAGAEANGASVPAP